MKINVFSTSLIVAVFAAQSLIVAQCPPPGKKAGGGSSNPGWSNPGVPSGPSPAPPSGPTTPSASGPSVPTTPSGPRPTGPSRTGGGPRVPVTPGPATSGPRGVPIVFTRGRTSKRRLDITWDVPVYTRRQRSGRATEAATRKSLTFAQALQFVRGDDPRPLLVMRECDLCVGTDYALLRRGMQNERTMLLTYWFHCVRLPASVRHEDHGLRNLFGGVKPPHLFFATADGSDLLTLPGNQNQSDLWKAMTGILRKSYKGDAERSVRALLRLLNDFDALDSSEAQLRRRLDQAVESEGPKSSKFKRLNTKLTRLIARRSALLKREAKLRELTTR